MVSLVGPVNGLRRSEQRCLDQEPQLDLLVHMHNGRLACFECHWQIVVFDMAIDLVGSQVQSHCFVGRCITMIYGLNGLWSHPGMVPGD